MTIGEVSMIINAIGMVPYVIGIIKGEVKPERTSWLIWSLILALGLVGYIQSGGNDSVWFLVGDFVVTFMIFLLALWRGVGGLTKLNVTCLCVALVGLVVWQTTQQPILAVIGALVADAIALLPTLIKALREPYSESPSTFSFSAGAAVLGVIAVDEWNFMLLFYPVYLFLANFVTAMVIAIGQYHERRLGRAPEKVSSLALFKKCVYNIK